MIFWLVVVFVVTLFVGREFLVRELLATIRSYRDDSVIRDKIRKMSDIDELIDLRLTVRKNRTLVRTIDNKLNELQRERNSQQTY